MCSIGMPLVHPPANSPFERSPLGSTFLPPAKDALSMGLAQNAEANKYIKSVMTGMDVFEYFSGNTDKLPLELSKISSIKENIKSLREKSFSAKVIVNIFTQTVLLGSTYLGYIEMLHTGESSPKLPYMALLIPSVKLYGQITKSIEIIKTLIQNKETNNTHLQLIKLLGCFVSTLLYGLQIIIYLYISQLSARITLILGSIASFASIYELLFNEYTRSTPILSQASQTPTLYMKV